MRGKKKRYRYSRAGDDSLGFLVGDKVKKGWQGLFDEGGMGWDWMG